VITNLYYFLGFLPSLFFGSRFLIQWLQSEQQQRCVVSPLFWKLSLVGNILLALHYYLQCQFPFFLLQAINGCIAWRNLNLLKSSPYSLQGTLVTFSSIVLLACCACGMAKMTFGQGAHWCDVPLGLLHQHELRISWGWHLVGIAGGVLFASRFWLQWIEAEKQQKSLLSRSFWILSLVGSAISLCYFLCIKDTMSILYALFGLIPYVRNLVLSKPKAIRE